MEKLIKKLDYQFNNINLLDEALTHPSVTKKISDKRQYYNYERLEFLGDAVLGLVIAELLLEKYPDEKEGALAKRQAGLVRGETVANIANDIGIGSFIQMTRGEEAMGGRENANNVENALEAVIGAMFLDGGLQIAEVFIKKHWTSHVDEMKEPPKDPKTTLQEWAQSKGLEIPFYQIVKSEGPSHAPTFTVRVTVSNYDPVEATGKSRKKAEKEAAEILLTKIAS